MKKLITIALIFVMLVGCSSTADVEITLPANMLGEETDLEDTIANAKEKGIKEVIQNDDGSLTYKMSKKTHDDMMAELKDTLISSINDIKDNEEIKSIKDITYDDDFTEITLIVDQAAYENSLDSIAAVGIIFSAMYYQIFDGVNSEDIKATLNIKDAETNEIIDTTVYPDSLVEK